MALIYHSTSVLKVSTWPVSPPQDLAVPPLAGTTAGRERAWGGGVLLLLPWAGGVKPSKVKLRPEKGKEKRDKNEDQGAGWRAARSGGGVGWGSIWVLPLFTLSPSLLWGFGAGSRWGVALLANAGASPQKTNYLW